MKIIEVVIGIIVLISILWIGSQMISLSNKKAFLYWESIENDSNKISLYNFSNKLINDNNITKGKINIVETGFILGENDGYEFECIKKSDNLIKIGEVYTGLFCEINFNENENIHNFNIY